MSSDPSRPAAGHRETDLRSLLESQVGRTGAVSVAFDAVNAAMIRHWCDAMDDRNPVYTDPEQAARSRHGEIVAPPAMLNAWNMPGLTPPPASGDEPLGKVMDLLDAAGFTSVVATNCDHEYDRYLKLGDRLTQQMTVSDVSPQKSTALGTGHFVTMTTCYRLLAEQAGELGDEVGRMRFRILKFKPGTGRIPAVATEGDQSPPRPKRPAPGQMLETRFFWEGLRAGELRIQQCAACGALHHPPRVRCHECGGWEFGHRVASGRATVYSHVEPCHPQIPSFDYPYLVGLVELEEGTRLLTNIVDIDPEAVHCGMKVELDIRHLNSEIPLPVFRPERPARNETTRSFDEVEVGELLPYCPVPITATSIVAGAIASRDYQDVHHDRALAIERGSPDIFMNILTTSGLCGRFVGDWAGPEALLKNLSVRLGAPNYPGDCMTLSGVVSDKCRSGDERLVEIALRGKNRLGDHVTGSITMALPGQ